MGRVRAGEEESLNAPTPISLCTRHDLLLLLLCYALEKRYLTRSDCMLFLFRDDVFVFSCHLRHDLNFENSVHSILWFRKSIFNINCYYLLQQYV